LPKIRLIEDLTTQPVPPGSSILIEYDGASQWYNASITIAAEWLRTGGTMSYSAMAQSPDTVRKGLKRLGLNVEELERNDKLRLFDAYSLTLGLKSNEKYVFPSLKASEMSIYFSQRQFQIAPELERIRLADDWSTFERFNEPKAWVEFVLTRAIPLGPISKSTGIHGLMRGLHNDWVYNRLEAANDGVVDFRLDESVEPPRNLIRIRKMRDLGFDGRWHDLKIGANSEVSLTN
jgi:KaiC/GvpD/RAD55 family RecA-like ATPase